MAAGATEIMAVYFEDPCVRPGIMNLAVRKGLWAYMQKYVAALRAQTAAAALSNDTSRQVCAYLLHISCHQSALRWWATASFPDSC